MIKDIFIRLANSKFRSNFKLSNKDFEYIESKGFDKIEEHAFDFVKKRLAPKVILNDGKQTPYHGHPIFVAQHATACCCRDCLYKWHKIAKNKELNMKEIKYIVNILMIWIKKEYKKYKEKF